MLGHLTGEALDEAIRKDDAASKRRDRNSDLLTMFREELRRRFERRGRKVTIRSRWVMFFVGLLWVYMLHGMKLEQDGAKDEL